MIEDTDYIINQLEEEAKTLPEQKNQCLQHLIELGYIPMSKVNALNDLDFENAKSDFFKDAQISGLFTENELRRQIFEDEEEFLAELLGDATDIDEGFRFESLPEKGTVNLITRIIHYRLDIFGLWPFAINAPFNIVTSVAALQKIGEYASCTALEVINYLADVEELTKRLLKVHKDEDFILAFKTKKAIDKKVIKDLDHSGKFKNQLKQDFGGRSEFFKYLNDEVLNEKAKNVDFTFLNREAINPFKQFVLRLIQVHQWQDGLYEGLLDSDIGEVTIKSILTAIELYKLAGNKSIQSYRVLTHVVNGYFLFNGLYFLQEYMIEEGDKISGSNSEEKIVSDVLSNVERSDDQTLNAFQLNMEVLKIELVIASKSQPEEKKGFLKRIYFGIKKFLKKIVSISKKIFGWIVDLTKKFWGILKKVFGHFFSKLAKGIKAFVDGIKFLLGKKSMTTKNDKGLISSVIRMDGDCFNIVAGNSTGIIHEHNKKIKYNVTSMEFALTIVGGVLNIVMKAFSVLSWPMLIFSIIKIFKNISESYKKLELITT